MHEQAVALADAARGEPRRERRDLGLDLAPGPGAFAPDEARLFGKAARVLGTRWARFITRRETGATPPAGSRSGSSQRLQEDRSISRIRRRPADRRAARRRRRPRPSRRAEDRALLAFEQCRTSSARRRARNSSRSACIRLSTLARDRHASARPEAPRTAMPMPHEPGKRTPRFML